MNKVLLINPAFEFKVWKKRDNYIFPYGLGHVAAWLLKNGHEVEVWDIYKEKIDFDEVVECLPRKHLDRFDHIQFTGLVNQFLYIKELAKEVRKYSSAVLTLGGPLATYSYEIVLMSTVIDICVLGEGEQTDVEIVSNRPWDQIRGIAYQDSEQIVLTEPRQPIKNLDFLGLPAFSLFDMEAYSTKTAMMDTIRPFYRGNNLRIMGTFTSRGCPYSCRFCSKSSRGARFKSLDVLFSELDYCVEKFNINCFHFIDELLVFKRDRIRDFCERIKQRPVVWDCQARVNHVDRDILRIMKDSGCVCVGFGIESCSQTILDRMNKKTTVQQIRRALTDCREIGLPVKIQLIYGFPGENDRTLEETISFFQDLRFPHRRFGVITPLPGAPLYEEAKQDGFIGDGENDQISEEKFLEFLSTAGGWCNRDLFYNRTAFSDQDFFKKLDYAERRLFWSFFIDHVLHFQFMKKHFSYHKPYLFNYWKYRNRITSYRYLTYPFKAIRNPKKAYARLLKFLWN